MGESNVHCLSWWDVCLHGLMSSREEKGGSLPYISFATHYHQKEQQKQITNIYIVGSSHGAG